MRYGKLNTTRGDTRGNWGDTTITIRDVYRGPGSYRAVLKDTTVKKKDAPKIETKREHRTKF